VAWLEAEDGSSKPPLSSRGEHANPEHCRDGQHDHAQRQDQPGTGNNNQTQSVEHGDHLASHRPTASAACFSALAERNDQGPEPKLMQPGTGCLSPKPAPASKAWQAGKNLTVLETPAKLLWWPGQIPRRHT
jgi:hypothetical protein